MLCGSPYLDEPLYRYVISISRVSRKVKANRTFARTYDWFRIPQKGHRSGGGRLRRTGFYGGYAGRRIETIGSAPSSILSKPRRVNSETR